MKFWIFLSHKGWQWVLRENDSRAIVARGPVEATEKEATRGAEDFQRDTCGASIGTSVKK